MKFTVLKTITRRSEDNKVYHPGDEIELSKEDAIPLQDSGLIQMDESLLKIDKSKKKTK